MAISNSAAATSNLGLTEPELRKLSACATAQTFPKNTVVINEGDGTNAVFIIKAGSVKVFLRGKDDKEVVLNFHGPGEYFGELALSDAPRSASVVTLERTTVLIIPKQDFKQFLSANPDFALRLINRLMGRVRVLTENVKNLALLDVYGRVARLLLELAVEEDGRLIIIEKLSQKDIADRVGASREMISRIFKDLVAGGYISMEKKQITITRGLPRRW